MRDLDHDTRRGLEIAHSLLDIMQADDAIAVSNQASDTWGSLTLWDRDMCLPKALDYLESIRLERQ